MDMLEPNKNVEGEKLMNENLLKAVSLYCNNEIEDLKSSESYIKLTKLVDELKYNLVCDYGKAIDNKKSENIYLGVQILDDTNELIEIFDEGFLTTSTLLILVDKKHRYKFFLGEMMNLLKI